MEPNDANTIPEAAGKLKWMYSGVHKTSPSHEFESECAKMGSSCRPIEVLGSQAPLNFGSQEKGLSETLNVFGDTRQSNLALLHMLEGIGMNGDEAGSVPACSFNHGPQLLLPVLEQQRSWGFQELLSFPICDNDSKRESPSFDEFLHSGHGSEYDLNLTSCRRAEWPNYNFMQRVEVQPFEPESCITHVSESCTSLVKTEAKDQFSSLDAPEEGVSSSSREPNSSNTVNSSDNCNDKGLGNINGYQANTATRERIRKRKRSRVCKNSEEVESQRMTHIAVERNRRKQMNEHLTVLRSLMPVSFIQRGDQASIIGGAIDFVKELEQLLQSLQAQAQKRRKQCELEGCQSPKSTATPFNGFFLSPQYTSYSSQRAEPKCEMENSNLDQHNELTAESKSAIADVEVTVIETHASLKVLSLKRPGQLLKVILALENLDMTILHLNITTIDLSVLYSFNVKIEEECQLTSANEIASAVHQIFSIIHSNSTNPVRSRVS